RSRQEGTRARSGRSHPRLVRPAGEPAGVSETARQSAGAFVQRSLGIPLQTQPLAVPDLNLQQLLPGQPPGPGCEQPHHSAVGYQQQVLSGVPLIQPIDGSHYPLLEQLHPFSSRRSEAVGRCPEATQILSTFFHQLRGMAAFPFPEMQLAQVLLQHKRQVTVPGQLEGEISATAQGRTDDCIPLTALAGRLSHLLPASRCERVIQTAAEAAAQFRLAMAQEIQRQHAVGSAATAASAKVAMPLCRAQAMRSSGTAAAAPVPSPSRMPTSSSGAPARPASTAAWPGSALRWPNSIQSWQDGFSLTAQSAAVEQMKPSTSIGRPCCAAAR